MKVGCFYSHYITNTLNISLKQQCMWRTSHNFSFRINVTLKCWHWLMNIPIMIIIMHKRNTIGTWWDNANIKWSIVKLCSRIFYWSKIKQIFITIGRFFKNSNVHVCGTILRCFSSSRLMVVVFVCSLCPPTLMVSLQRMWHGFISGCPRQQMTSGSRKHYWTGCSMQWWDWEIHSTKTILML